MHYQSKFPNIIDLQSRIIWFYDGFLFAFIANYGTKKCILLIWIYKHISIQTLVALCRRRLQCWSYRITARTLASRFYERKRKNTRFEMGLDNYCVKNKNIVFIRISSKILTKISTSSCNYIKRIKGKCTNKIWSGQHFIINTANKVWKLRGDFNFQIYTAWIRVG